MRRTTTFVAGGVVTLVTAMAFLSLRATPALAHEARTVGAYHFAVGFGDEPAYTGQKNSVQLFLHDAKDRPVVDLGDTLKVEVSYANQPATLSLAIEPDFEVGEFGTPGDYRAWFFPTRPGNYRFHFTGTIKGQQVDESFTSGPTTFSSVEDPTGVEFPAKDPSAAQVAQRLDREVPRLTAALASARSKAQHDASGARTLAIAGIAVGVVGLMAGVAGLLAARHSRTGEPARSPATEHV